MIIPENIRPKEVLLRRTRHSSAQGNIKLEVPFAKTVTSQTSFLIRSCEVWNILDSELIERNTNLNTFRKGLKAYYMRALSNVFNSEDPRTWKSVCFKCKRARSLVVSPSCCY